MGMPITTNEKGICFAFPDVCDTPGPSGPVKIPYPNIGQLADATGPDSKVLAGGFEVVTTAFEIETTSGDEAGSAGQNTGKVAFSQGSNSVKVKGSSVVRMLDTTEQNAGNAVGTVLGGFPKVLVGD